MTHIIKKIKTKYFTGEIRFFQDEKDGFYSVTFVKNIFGLPSNMDCSNFYKRKDFAMKYFLKKIAEHKKTIAGLRKNPKYQQCFK